MPNYFSKTTGVTEAARLDQAFHNYLFPDSENPTEKDNALKHLIFILDLHHFIHDRMTLDALIKDLFELRMKHKENNPDYIPIITSGNYALDVNATVLPPIGTEKDEQYSVYLIALDHPKKITDLRKDTLTNAENRNQPILIKQADGSCCVYGNKNGKWCFTQVQIDAEYLSDLPFENENPIAYNNKTLDRHPIYSSKPVSMLYFMPSPVALGNMVPSNEKNLHLYKVNEEFVYKIGNELIKLQEVPEKLKTEIFPEPNSRNERLCNDREIYCPILNSTLQLGQTFHYNHLFDTSLITIVDQAHAPNKASAEMIEALKQGTLLDVGKQRKINDKGSTTFLDSKERDLYNLQISGGLFYKSGELLSTNSYVSHNKSGFAAFTLNANGECSIFTHEGKNNSALKHSSMNAGSPVLAAGEIEIMYGKLQSITTYSGHYAPTLYSTLKFLEYLSSRGVDISNATVYLHEPPKEGTGLNAKPVVLSRREDMDGDIIEEKCYACAAKNLVYNSKMIMNDNIATINEFLAEYKPLASLISKIQKRKTSESTL